MTKKIRRTKDKGVTRNNIIKLMQGKPRTVPELREVFVWQRLEKDVLIRTAINNMYDEGLIEILNPVRSCYDATLFGLVGSK